MPWDGIERRREQRAIAFCPAHIELVADMAVIKTSLKNIETTITESVSFKGAVMIGFSAIGVTIILQIIAFAFLFGQLNKQVEINTSRLDITESMHRIPLQGIQGIQGIQGRDGRDAKSV